MVMISMILSYILSLSYMSVQNYINKMEYSFKYLPPYNGLLSVCPLSNFETSHLSTIFLFLTNTMAIIITIHTITIISRTSTATIAPTKWAGLFPDGSNLGVVFITGGTDIAGDIDIDWDGVEMKVTGGEVERVLVDMKLFPLTVIDIRFHLLTTFHTLTWCWYNSSNDCSWSWQEWRKW